MPLPAFSRQSAANQAAIQPPLPARLRVLCVAGRQRLGSDLVEAFAAQAEVTVFLEEAIGAAAGMARLNDEAYDIVIAEHAPDGIDALALTAGIRAAGGEEPVLVLGAEPPHRLLAESLAAGAEGYLCVSQTTPQALAWTVARATGRMALVRDQRRLTAARQQRQDQEQVEVRRLIQQQQAALGGLGGACDAPLPIYLTDHYRELLRAYIVMGSGHLAEELTRLVELFVAAEVSAPQAVRLHLCALDEVVRSLGSRGTRHVLLRADLLALEVAVKMAEISRQQAA